MISDILRPPGGIVASPLDLLPLAMLGGVLGLDVVSFPQAMISRPIVAATIAGAFAGAPLAGLVCGAALECLALEALPVGASRYPEWGSASAVAGVLAAHGASAGELPQPGALVVAIVVGIVIAWLGGWTMVRHRRLIARWARPRLDLLAAGNARTVVSLQVFGLSLDFLRGAALTLLALLPSLWLTSWVEPRWSLDASMTRAAVAVCVAGVAAAAVWKDFHAIRYTRRLFLAALAVGTFAVMLRG